VVIVEDNIKTKDLEISFTEPPYTDEPTKHEHEHTHEDGTTHSHEHTHEGSEEIHDHEHEKVEKVKPKKSKEPQVKSGKINIPSEAKKGKDFVINFGKKWDFSDIELFNGLREQEPTTNNPFNKEGTTGDVFITINSQNVDKVKFPMSNIIDVKGKKIDVLKKGEKILIKVHVWNQATEESESKVITLS